jgi:hypothetical protein
MSALGHKPTYSTVRLDIRYRFKGRQHPEATFDYVFCEGIFSGKSQQNQNSSFDVVPWRAPRTTHKLLIARHILCNKACRYQQGYQHVISRISARKHHVTVTNVSMLTLEATFPKGSPECDNAFTTLRNIPLRARAAGLLAVSSPKSRIYAALTAQRRVEVSDTVHYRCHRSSSKNTPVVFSRTPRSQPFIRHRNSGEGGRKRPARPRRSFKNRRRHLPTVYSWTPSSVPDPLVSSADEESPGFICSETHLWIAGG